MLNLDDFPPLNEPIPLEHRTLFRSCQWIADEPSWLEDCKCGLPTFGAIYCAVHAALAHLPNSSERELSRRRREESRIRNAAQPPKGVGQHPALEVWK